jgi:hypothetical protein
MRSTLGWFNGDVENNSAPPRLRNELALDKQARRLGLELWAAQGFRSVLRIMVVKIGAFWLSTDQVFDISTFSLRERMLRWTGVVVYLIFLAFAVSGWFQVRHNNPSVAWMFLGFAILITAFHLAVTMNTRLRVPFFDSLIASFAAVGVSRVGRGLQRRNRFRKYEVAC